jgi:hypothetical protein
MKLWLDDVRPPWKHGYIGWDWAKTYDKAVVHVQERFNSRRLFSVTEEHGGILPSAQVSFAGFAGHAKRG